MLIVTVTLIPGGDRSRAQEIASASISNISDLSDLSTYSVLARERGSDLTGLPDQTTGFEVANHIRRQSVWGLVTAVAVKAAREMNAGRGAKRRAA